MIDVIIILDNGLASVWCPESNVNEIWIKINIHYQEKAFAEPKGPFH